MTGDAVSILLNNNMTTTISGVKRKAGSQTVNKAKVSAKHANSSSWLTGRNLLGPFRLRLHPSRPSTMIP